MGKNQGPGQQRTPGGGDLLKAARSGEPVDEALLLQLQEALHSQALILMRDFTHLDVCWESSTADWKQSRRLLKCAKDSFLVQVLEQPIRGEALLDLVLTSVEEIT